MLQERKAERLSVSVGPFCSTEKEARVLTPSDTGGWVCPCGSSAKPLRGAVRLMCCCCCCQVRATSRVVLLVFRWYCAVGSHIAM